MQLSLSRALCRWILMISPGEIPQSVFQTTKRMLVDTLACIYAGGNAPGINAIINLERQLSAPGNASLFFHEQKLALPSAVFCNAAMAHALDLDQNYPSADLHILCIVVPIALACAEANRRNGHDLLTAIILGVEVAGRIAKPYIAARRPHHFFLTSSLVGGWGGVAAAARLLSLSESETVHAMGIYYAHACGNRQALLEKTLTKRLQPAIAAKNALYSVELARCGISGPEAIFEGKAGFYRCYTSDPPPSPALFSAQAGPFAIEGLLIKKYPTCGIHHACIEAALELHHRYSIRPEAISKFSFYLEEGGSTLVSLPYRPSSPPQIAAQFCASYAIALALCCGEVSVSHFLDDAILRNTRVAHLATGAVEADTFSDLELARYATARSRCQYLKVELTDGTILEAESSRDALLDIGTGSHAFLEKKLTQCMEAVNSPLCPKSILDAVESLEKAPNVDILLGLLR